VTCSDAGSLFTRSLDRRLADGDRAALADHLSRCAACRAELARWDAVAKALRGLGPTPVPPALAERAFRAAVATDPPPLAAWFVVAARRAVVAGAAAAAAVWIGVFAAGTPDGAPAAANGADDPMELAVQLQLWTPEAHDAP
jgi:anti-sigma factor RsiW